MRKWCIPLLALIWLVSCKSEEEITEGMQSGIVATRTVFRLLPLTHVLNHFIQPYQSQFLPSFLRVDLIDSSNTDGDGFEYLVYFGTSTSMPDGLSYKNQLHVLVSDTNRSYSDTGRIVINDKDSFAIHAATGWNYYTGYLSWQGIGSDSVLLHADFTVRAGTEKSRIVLNSQYSSRIREGALNNYIHGMGFSGTAVVYDNEAKLTLTLESLTQPPGCFSNWASGNIKAVGTDNKTWNSEMNPYGNGACDKVFKVTHTENKRTYEMIFNAW